MFASLSDAIPLYFFYLAYLAFVGFYVVDGHVREIFGKKKHNAHNFFWQLHTGKPIDPRRSYGDERRLNRTAGSTNRATPEGQMVYFHPWGRKYRALRNNVIVISFISLIYGFIFDTVLTIRLITITIVFGIGGLIAHRIRLKRKEMMLTRVPEDKVKTAQTKKAKAVLAAEKSDPDYRPPAEVPKIVSGIPSQVMALLLSEPMGCSTAELLRLMKVSAERGQLTLPDHFAALQKQKDIVQEIITSHTTGKLAFNWETTTSPRMVVWKPVKTGLPSVALFRNYLPEIAAAKPGTFAVGPTEQGNVYFQDHNGDNPWHCTSAGSGTGKSTRFLIKAIQILHNDPTAELYCIDTKQISFEVIKGLPRVHLFDNPQSEMSEIWKVFYTLEGIMRDRYTAVREGRIRPEDFSNIWILVDEGNDLQGWLKNHYTHRIREKGEQAAPVIWAEAIAPLLRLGRQVNIRGEFMLQDITDRALGGESLKMAFGTFGMAGWKKAQWDRIVGPPVPALINGPGRIMMVTGNNQEWVQGFYDTPEYLRAYATAGVQERKAS
jgi:hypothetical protein